MIEPPTPEIPFWRKKQISKEKITVIGIFLILGITLFISFYALKIENKYNDVIMELNDLRMNYYCVEKTPIYQDRYNFMLPNLNETDKSKEIS